MQFFFRDFNFGSTFQRLLLQRLLQHLLHGFHHLVLLLVLPAPVVTRACEEHRHVQLLAVVVVVVAPVLVGVVPVLRTWT